jgi:hypothetical protein
MILALPMLSQCCQGIHTYRQVGETRRQHPLLAGCVAYDFRLKVAQNEVEIHISFRMQMMEKALS